MYDSEYILEIVMDDDCFPVEDPEEKETNFEETKEKEQWQETKD